MQLDFQSKQTVKLLLTSLLEKYRKILRILLTQP